jgi:prephenate dehydrogenase
MWRDVAITNKKNISDVIQKLEQRLAHIRENLDSRELAAEFEQAHQLRKHPPVRHGDTQKIKE